VILIESEEKKFTFTIKTKMKNYSLTTNHKAILVDFGFACANVDSEIVAAGNYLPTFDGCPKVGRDMFLFLSNLWNVEVLRSKLTAGFQKWICNRLQTEKKSWSSYLENTKDPFMKLIYLFTTSSGFYVHECSPQRILETIADEFPEILKIS
jgi:hypothetical protein